MYISPSVKPLCPPESKPKFQGISYADVELDNGSPYTLKMDIYQSENQKEQGPAIFYIFGGGWMWGEYTQVTQKAVYCRDLVRLSEQGFTVICPDYRLASQSIFPACIHDVKGAVRFIKANAPKFNIDAGRIGILGNSAGGHLAAMIAMSSNDPEMEGNVGGNLEYSSSVQAAAVFYAPTDLLELVRNRHEERQKKRRDLSGTEVESLVKDNEDAFPCAVIGYIGENQGLEQLYQVMESEDKANPDWKYVELLKKCSPVHYASKENPPMAILHGGRDPLVPPEQSELLYQALLKENADATMICYSAGSHGPSLGEQVDRFAYEFLKDRL